MLGVEPEAFTGTVLDIGSGDDSFGLELYAAGVEATIHRVNPALGPDAPIEVQFAMREAIYMRAAQIGVDPSVVRSWGLSHNVFPDITGLPSSDHIMLLYSFFTIFFECHMDGVRKLRKGLDKGFEAIADLVKPEGSITVGPFKLGEPLVEVKRAISRQKVLSEKRAVLRHGFGEVLLRLT